MLQALPLVFVLAGLALYTVLGGADLGAGFWQLSANRGEDGECLREFAHRSMAPVWEANHVWLIFVLTVFWTAYPKAFGSIASTLAIPLFVALVGILFRGAAYALRSGALTSREAGRIDTVFALSSILVPFALGAAVGGIAANRVPVGNAAGHLWSSWLSVTSILIGVLAVTTAAHLAAVFLAADAARDKDPELEDAFRLRALGSGLVAGGLAFAGIFVVDANNHALFHSLVSSRALAAVVVSGVAGFATLGFIVSRRYELARYMVALAVAAITAGWALARWPTILPNLSVDQAAAPHDTLVCVVVAVLGGAVILFPALGILFRLAVAGRFRAPELSAEVFAKPHGAPTNLRLLGRVAIASLIAGVGLLNVAEAGWAHAFGVVFLIGFVAVAFGAVAVPALSTQTSSE